MTDHPSLFSSLIVDVLLAVLNRLRSKGTLTWIRTRSAKLVPGARRIEVFSRQKRAGWSNWGHEAAKFGST